AGAGPPGGTAGNPGPQAELRFEGGAPGKSGTTTGIGHQHASGLFARQRAPRHLGKAVGTEVTRHETVGSEKTGMTTGTGSDIWIVWLDSGHRVTRHQVICSTAGNASIWQGSEHRVTRHDKWALMSIVTTKKAGSRLW
ncbi:unnamed protein product, partial [Staurois parvus]